MTFHCAALYVVFLLTRCRGGSWHKSRGTWLQQRSQLERDINRVYAQTCSGVLFLQLSVSKHRLQKTLSVYSEDNVALRLCSWNLLFTSHLMVMCKWLSATGNPKCVYGKMRWCATTCWFQLSLASPPCGHWEELYPSWRSQFSLINLVALCCFLNTRLKGQDVTCPNNES